MFFISSRSSDASGCNCECKFSFFIILLFFRHLTRSFCYLYLDFFLSVMNSRGKVSDLATLFQRNNSKGEVFFLFSFAAVLAFTQTCHAQPPPSPRKKFTLGNRIEKKVLFETRVQLCDALRDSLEDSKKKKKRNGIS